MLEEFKLLTSNFSAEYVAGETVDDAADFAHGPTGGVIMARRL
jgi:hypothetical protein